MLAFTEIHAIFFFFFFCTYANYEVTVVQLLLIQTKYLKETPLRKKNTAVLCKIPFFSDSSLWNDLCDIPNTSVDEDALKALRENDPRETRREFAIKMDVHRSTIIRRLSSIGKVNNLNERTSYNLKDRNKFDRYRFTMIIVSNIRRLNKVSYTYFKTILLFTRHIVGMRLEQKMTSRSKFFSYA